MKLTLYISLVLLTAYSLAVSGESLTQTNAGNIQSYKTLSAIEIYDTEITGRYNVFETCPESEGNFIFNKTNVDQNGHDYCQIGTMKKNEHSSTVFIKLIKCGSEGFPAEDMEVSVSKNNSGAIIFGGWWDYEPFSLYVCPKNRKKL